MKREQAKPYLLTKSIDPENQETPIHFIKGDVVGSPLFYRRNHFSYPSFLTSFYWLPIEGTVHAPKVFSFQEILMLPAKTINAVLECAGNKREHFMPKVFGEQWGKGALSQGVWKGVPLRTLLQYTGWSEMAKEVVFEGYDYGTRPGSSEVYHFARSLPIEKALHSDTIIAYEYNGRLLPFKHGYPLRLIVPGWYAMASVKWLKKITVINTQFKGPFQAIDYNYYPNKDNDDGKSPVTAINVNSTIQQPLNRQILSRGVIAISGIAWTGAGEITDVEISLDGGLTWKQCELGAGADKYSWVRWSYRWEALRTGEYTIMSRAADSAGRLQPEKPLWNKKGYGYNARDVIRVKID